MVTKNEIAMAEPRLKQLWYWIRRKYHLRFNNQRIKIIEIYGFEPRLGDMITPRYPLDANECEYLGNDLYLEKNSPKKPHI